MAKHLTTNDITYDIHDIRISTGEGAPADDFGEVGDIYIRKTNQTLTHLYESNGWYYRITADGLCECWKYFTKSFSMAGWENFYAKDRILSDDERAYPITFLEPPVCTATIHTAGGWIYTSTSTETAAGTTTYCPQLSYGTINHASPVNCKFGIYAIGRVF